MNNLSTGRGYAVDPTGELTAPPDPLASLRDPTSNGRGRGGRGEMERWGEEGNGRDAD